MARNSEAALPATDIYGPEFKNQVVAIVMDVLEKRGLTLAQIQEIKSAMHDALDALISNHQNACSQRLFEKVYKLVGMVGVLLAIFTGVCTIFINLAFAKYAPLIQKMLGAQNP